MICPLRCTAAKPFMSSHHDGTAACASFTCHILVFLMVLSYVEDSLTVALKHVRCVRLHFTFDIGHTSCMLTFFNAFLSMACQMVDYIRHAPGPAVFNEVASWALRCPNGLPKAPTSIALWWMLRANPATAAPFSSLASSGALVFSIRGPRGRMVLVAIPESGMQLLLCQRKFFGLFFFVLLVVYICFVIVCVYVILYVFVIFLYLDSYSYIFKPFTCHSLRFTSSP
jgi:hypothetical protein